MKKRLFLGLVAALSVVFSIWAASNPSPGSGGVAVKLGGSTLGTAQTIDFVSGVSGSFAGSTASLTASGGGGSSSSAFTNDGFFIYPRGTAPSNTAGIVIRKDGSLFLGTNAWQDINMKEMGSAYPFYSVSLVASNEAPLQSFGMTVIDSEDYNYYGAVNGYVQVSGANNIHSRIKLDSFHQDTTGSAIDLFSRPGDAYFKMSANNLPMVGFYPWETNGVYTFDTVTNAGSTNLLLVLRNNRTNNFWVTTDGSASIRRVPYVWPSANAAGQLVNNGSGTLSWSTPVANASFHLSPQAAKMPATNYPALDAFYQLWELNYFRTNAEGANVATSAAWQFPMPTDYVTNSLTVTIYSTLSATNGPNSSNTIFKVSFLRFPSAGTADTHTAAFGSTTSGTTTWTQSTSNTNKVQSVTISPGTASLVGAGELVVMKLERDAVNDTCAMGTQIVGIRCDYQKQ